MPKEELIAKIKLILMLVGGIAIIGVGLLFVLVTDLVYKNSSYWLFLAIITALGSGVTFLLADKFKNKEVIFYVLKGLGIFLAITFIFVILAYHGNTFVNKMFNVNGVSLKKKVETQAAQSFSTFITILGIVFATVQAGNIGLNIAFGIDE